MREYALIFLLIITNILYFAKYNKLKTKIDIYAAVLVIIIDFLTIYSFINYFIVLK